jgi:hypothetical protein
VECKIDSIPQSWSVLSKAGESKRSRIAMESAYKFLVRKNDSLIQLFDPPFDKSDLNPGYIKGYVPGVRENGGQYTHAAVWLVTFLLPKNSEGESPGGLALVVLPGLCYLFLLLAAGTPILADWLNKHW